MEDCVLLELRVFGSCVSVLIKTVTKLVYLKYYPPTIGWLGSVPVGCSMRRRRICEPKGQTVLFSLLDTRVT